MIFFLWISIRGTTERLRFTDTDDADLKTILDTFDIHASAAILYTRRSKENKVYDKGLFVVT